jgi:enamine deaminase RidA (YjgF/YER057c/UK114 family)
MGFASLYPSYAAEYKRGVVPHAGATARVIHESRWFWVPAFAGTIAILADVKGEIAMTKEFINPKTLIPPGPAGYSHVAKVNHGTIVYLSGQVPSDASGKLIGEGDFEAQVEQVFRNLKVAVEAAGGTMADIVKLNYYLVAEVDQAIVPKLRPIRDRYINVENPPASTFVVVSRLMRPGWMIEIEAVAAIDA